MATATRSDSPERVTGGGGAFAGARSQSPDRNEEARKSFEVKFAGLIDRMDKFIEALQLQIGTLKRKIDENKAETDQKFLAAHALISTLRKENEGLKVLINRIEVTLSSTIPRLEAGIKEALDRADGAGAVPDRASYNVQHHDHVVFLGSSFSGSTSNPRFW